MQYISYAIFNIYKTTSIPNHTRSLCIAFVSNSSSMGNPFLDKLSTFVTFYMYFHIVFLPRSNQTKTLVQVSFISFSITPSVFGYTCDSTMKMPKLEWVFLHRSFKKESHSLAKGLSCVASPKSSSSSIITRIMT